MQKSAILLIFCMLFITACVDPEPVDISEVLADNADKVSITQGIAGTVIYKEGNFMPPVVPNSGIQYPVSRKVFLYEYTQLAHLPDDSFISKDSISSTLISQTRSDCNGFYQFEIADTGSYSIFVQENGKFFSDYFDFDWGSNSIIIHENSITNYNIFLDYNATY